MLGFPVHHSGRRLRGDGVSRLRELDGVGAQTASGDRTRDAAAGWQALCLEGRGSVTELVSSVAGYDALPIRVILVLQTGQVPWVAGRPFLRVT